VWIWSALIDGKGLADLWFGILGLILMLPAASQKELRQSEFWRGLPKRVFVALVETFEDMQMEAAARKAVKRAYGHRSLLERLRRRVPSRRAVGTALMVVGIGVSVLVVPNVLRYVVQPRVRLSAEPVFLAVAAMMVVGGWFIRQPPGR
jgi:formate-dependent nitrite reductase membrane component NrfD